MKHLTTDANEILKQRGQVYGSYSEGVKCRANIMESINNLVKANTGEDMHPQLRVMFSDLVLKIMRAASDPSHIDSWVDLEGYAKLIKEEHVNGSK